RPTSAASCTWPTVRTRGCTSCGSRVRPRRSSGRSYGHRSFTTGSFVRQFRIDCRQGCGVARDPLAASQWLRLARQLWPPDAEAAAAAQQGLELEIMALDDELTEDQKAEVSGQVAPGDGRPALT